jgi:L-asparaginase II
VIQEFELDVIATRGGLTESRHRVHAAICADGGKLVGAARDPKLNTCWRSGAKPFQVFPLIESGGFDQLGWGEDQLAIACASHGGEPEHVAIVSTMLRDLGLEEGDLVCGPHDPLSPRGGKILRESGGRITRLHNNCSGKHVAMMAAAKTAGFPVEGYERREHPVQQAILRTISGWAEIDPEQITTAVDGCGVTVFGMPLENMARAYARLAQACRNGDVVPCRIARAMVNQPFLVGGTERFDSLVMESAGASVICKVGAEGIHCAALMDLGVGIALKVEDGNPRAQHPAMLRLLQLLGALPTALPPKLYDFMRKPVRNSRNEAVGEVVLRADC